MPPGREFGQVVTRSVKDASAHNDWQRGLVKGVGVACDPPVAQWFDRNRTSIFPIQTRNFEKLKLVVSEPFGFACPWRDER